MELIVPVDEWLELSEKVQSLIDEPAELSRYKLLPEIEWLIVLVWPLWLKSWKKFIARIRFKIQYSVSRVQSKKFVDFGFIYLWFS